MARETPKRTPKKMYFSDYSRNRPRRTVRRLSNKKKNKPMMSLLILTSTFKLILSDEKEKPTATKKINKIQSNRLEEK